MIMENNCLHYEHQEGAPEPGSRRSCRGCKYAHDPKLYDPVCCHPDGFKKRHQAGENRRRNTSGRTRDQLSTREQKRVEELVNRANEAHRNGKILGTECR